MKAHDVVTEGSRAGIDCECGIIRRAYCTAEIPACRISKNAASTGMNLANLCVQAVVEDSTITRRAIAGQGRRRAQQKRPRSVKRGHYPHRSLREVQGFDELTLYPDH